MFLLIFTERNEEGKLGLLNSREFIPLEIFQSIEFLEINSKNSNELRNQLKIPMKSISKNCLPVNFEGV